MKRIWLLLVIGWMGIIFMFSAQIASESDQASGLVVQIVNHIFTIDNNQYSWLIDNLTFIVRKFAHMSEFAVLAFLLFNYLKYVVMNHLYISTFLIALIYAISDEIHQLFVVGRSGQFSDVCIDSIGIVVALFVIKLWNCVKKRC